MVHKGVSYSLFPDSRLGLTELPLFGLLEMGKFRLLFVFSRAFSHFFGKTLGDRETQMGLWFSYIAYGKTDILPIPDYIYQIS